MTALLLQETSAPPAAPVERLSPISSLRRERTHMIAVIHNILTGWYTHGAVSISIDGVPAFNTTDQCIEILERSRLSEIVRIHHLLTKNG